MIKCEICKHKEICKDKDNLPKETEVKAPFEIICKHFMGLENQIILGSYINTNVPMVCEKCAFYRNNQCEAPS